MRRRLLLFYFLLAAGCSPNSEADFFHEGEALCRQLTEELSQIETAQQLREEAPKLKGYFNKIAELAIAARRFQMEEERREEVEEMPFQASHNLSLELKRIYQLEGGREAVEKAAHEALLKLDAFEGSLIKKKKAR